MNQGYAVIERLCNKQEVCWECHKVLEAVKDCIVMNECGHMIHEGCLRSLQGENNFSCKSCKQKIKMAFILNQIQVVQIIQDGKNITRKRKVEYETKINDYFFKKIDDYNMLQEKLDSKEKEINELKQRISKLESPPPTFFNIQQDKQNFSFMDHQRKQSQYQPEGSVLTASLFSFNNSKDLFNKGIVLQSNQTDINNSNNNEDDIEEVSTIIDYNKSKEDSKRKKNPLLTSVKSDHLKFSFGFKKNNIFESPEKNRDTIISLNDSTTQNLEDMKTILYSQEQINSIKSFDNSQTIQSQNNNKTITNVNQSQDDIFSFAKSKQSSGMRGSNVSQSSQNSSLMRARIGLASSEQKNSSLIHKKIQNQRGSTSPFVYESPNKPQQIILIDDENQKTVHNHRSHNCSSCSKSRHSQPNSGQKQNSETSADRKKRFTTEFRLQSLSQARQKLNFFNLQPVPSSSNSNTNTQQIGNSQSSQSNINELEQTIIENKIQQVRSQTGSQSQNSQDTSSLQNSQQKITFNKNARRPHTDSASLSSQIIYTKLPKYAQKN